MPQTGDTYQIVFLVDLDTRSKGKDDDSLCEKTLNSISLNTLKLLTHFASQLNDTVQVQNLRWGYKFCNSVQSVGLDRSDFQEFNLKKFEEFEEKLESRFESERVKRAYKDNHDSCQNAKADVEEDRKLHAHKFTQYLRELMTDFQWDRPDVTSPVKSLYRGRGSKKPLLTEEKKQHNIVVLYSCCPHSKEELTLFQSDENCDQSTVMDSLMPTNLCRPFHDELKIRPFWVDLTLDTSVSNEKVSMIYSKCSYEQRHF